MMKKTETKNSRASVPLNGIQGLGSLAAGLVRCREFVVNLKIYLVYMYSYMTGTSELIVLILIKSKGLFHCTL